MIRGIHHVALVVDDFDLMLDFYQRVIGAKETTRLGWEAPNPAVDEIISVPGSSADIRILRVGNAYLELFKFHAPAGRPVEPDNSAADHGFRHIAFDVTDIDAEYERLLGEGVTFNSPPTQVELDGHPLRATYFTDPEGNIVEFQELLEGAADPMAVPGIETLQ